MQRYLVVAALFVLSIITYVDRACISVAKGGIARDLSLSDFEMGMVFGAFSLGYAIAQIPAGWVADRYGPRLALAAVVASWSGFTALTAFASGLWQLVFIRFLFGVGEAGAFPGSTRAFFNWLPVEERGRANGILFSGSRLGAAITFPMLVWMMSTWSWRGSFKALGILGFTWAGLWLLWFRDHPPTPLPAASSTGPKPIRLSEVFRTPVFVPAMVQYFAGNFTFFLALTWIHPFLKSRYALGDEEAARYAMVPLLLGATSQWITGFVTDRLYRGNWRTWSRRLPAITGFLLSAAFVVGAGFMPTALLASLCLAIATFGADMTIGPSWTYCADIAGKNSGSVSAAMNMVGNLGAFVSAMTFPALLSATGGPTTYFLLAAALNVSGAACWFRMKSVTA
jgi:ACS family glucarate transporter-like MFS transporter